MYPIRNHDRMRRGDDNAGRLAATARYLCAGARLGRLLCKALCACPAPRVGVGAAAWHRRLATHGAPRERRHASGATTPQRAPLYCCGRHVVVQGATRGPSPLRLSPSTACHHASHFATTHACLCDVQTHRAEARSLNGVEVGHEVGHASAGRGHALALGVDDHLEAVTCGADCQTAVGVDAAEDVLHAIDAHLAVERCHDGLLVRWWC